MTTLEMDRDNAGREWNQPGFLRRQFSPPTTYAQTVFDALFGIVAPVLCFVCDPIVFRSSEFGSALLVDYQAFAYLVSGVEILSLIIWLVWGRNSRQATRLAGGMLMAGAVFSGLIGILILPFTLMGLMLGIGVFGFIPFLTALVYLRNAQRAFRLAGKPAIVPEASQHQREVKTLGAGARIGATLVGCLLVLGPPAALSFAASMFVSQAMEAVLSVDEQKADLAINEITYLKFLAPPQLDKLISAYQQAQEPARKEQLKRRYLKLTGNDIDRTQRIFAD